jgi:hypothetical protein
MEFSDKVLHLLSATTAQPHVSCLLLILASHIAEVNIYTEQLPLMTMTGGRTPAIGAFADHDASLFRRVDSSNLIVNGALIL